jgi:hypothetical protein
MEVPKDKYDKLLNMVILFTKNNIFELEAKYKDTLNTENFTRLVQYLRSSSSKYQEVINPDILDIFAKADDSVYRISLKGRDSIVDYCRNNIVQDSLHGGNIEVIIKNSIPNVYPIFLTELGYKIDLKQEIPVAKYRVSELLKQLPLLDKGFRYKKRFSYILDKQFRFDLTITKSSKLIGREFLVHKNFIESNVTKSADLFEVEIEILRRPGELSVDKITNEFLRSMITAYTILQGDINIMSKKDKDLILKEYLQLCYGPNGQLPPKKKNKNNPSIFEDAIQNPKAYFFGPQPITLEKKNMVPSDLGIISILEDYTVTDKADGERSLLFISANGKCYLINNRLNIQYTGVKVSSISNTLLDGEFITKDILGNNIKLYAAFDIYFHNGVDTRAFPLISDSKSSSKSRYKIMKEFEIKIKEPGFDFKIKEFYEGPDILKLSKQIYDNSKIGNSVYHIDGLIYTPKTLGVGMSFEDDTPNNLGSWLRVFKWKPPHENTIDFLVKYEKDNYGKIYKISKDDNKDYRQLNLYVGFEPAQWESITSYNYLNRLLNRNEGYCARLFLPPDIIEDTFSQTEVEIIDNKVLCPNGDIIEDNSIVEFAYINDQWTPLRVRKDKTEALNKFGLSNTANDYKTALNVWKSIKEPVTIQHIYGEEKVNAIDIREDDIYYYRSVKREKMASRELMNYHNWIKNTIMQNIRKEIKSKNASLIDLAVGKGGDLSKWIENGFTKVLGIDIVKDNIENPIDGAWARTYQNYKKPKDSIFVYIPMDSSQLLDTNYISNIVDDQDQYIAKILFGDIKKGAILEDRLKEYHGYAIDKFEVISCQFALHYFYESETKLDNFVMNVNNFIKNDGYFIGTCLDGNVIKNKLKTLKYGEEITGKIKERTVWNIKKLYKKENKSLVGEEIEIYMESIGKRIKEYLVNIDLLIKKFKVHDINLVECKTFDKLYDTKFNLSDVEKNYSFMNMYFIFKKGKIEPKQEKQEELKPEEPKIEKQEEEPKPEEPKKIKVKLKNKN